MCGIAAILLYPQARPPQIWQEIAEIFTRNLLFNEARGQEATGAAVVQADGTLHVFKAPIPASRFIHLPEYHAILQRLNSQTTLLCGHTRQPTKGTTSQNENNHPLQVGAVLGVHNGHIENDDALFSQYGYPRAGQVDSEIIFRMLEPTSAETGNNGYLAVAAQSIRLLQGKFTFLACDQRAAHKLLC